MFYYEVGAVITQKGTLFLLHWIFGVYAVAPGGMIGGVEGIG